MRLRWEKRGGSGKECSASKLHCEKMQVVTNNRVTNSGSRRANRGSILIRGQEKLGIRQGQRVWRARRRKKKRKIWP